MDIERKGQQSIQWPLYVRFLCFGNGSLSALYDRFLAEKLKAESEGIFLWCLEGLKRLIRNNYEFTISGAAKSNLETLF